MRKKSFYFLLFGGFLFLLVVIGKWQFNVFVKKTLPNIIEEKNDTPYHLKYKEVDFSFFYNSLKVKEVTLFPKAPNDSLASKINGNIRQIEIQGIEFFRLLFDKKLIAQRISVIEPDFVYTPSSFPKKAQSDTAVLNNAIDIQKIQLQHGRLSVLNTNQELQQQLFNLSATIEGIHFGKYTKSKPIPFLYSDFSITCDSVFSALKNQQTLTAHQIAITPDHVAVKNVKIASVDAVQTDRPLPLEMEIPDFQLTRTDWGYDAENNFFIEIDKAKIDSLSIAVNTSIENDKQKSEIPSFPDFRFQIGEIAIANIDAKLYEQFELTDSSLHLAHIEHRNSDTLHIRSIRIDKPDIRHTPTKRSVKKASKKTSSQSIVQVDSLRVSHANYSLRSAKNNLEVQQFTLDVRTLSVTPSASDFSSAFTTQKIQLTTGAIHWDTKKFYDLHIANLELDNTEVRLDKLELKPKYSRKKHVAMLPYADDIFNVQVAEIALKGYEWELDEKNTPLISADLLQLSRIDANIYRNKTPEFNHSIKPLFSQKLRTLPFGLHVLKTAIQQSKLVYEEVDAKAIAPGKLTFTNFNAQVDHIVSGWNRNQAPDTSIRVDAQFMDAAPLEVDWSFNIFAPRDRFRIKGIIRDFPAPAMDAFLQPYVKASTEGSLSYVNFDFSGNNDYAVGSFTMNHNDLKVTLYRKDGVAKKRVLSRIGNWFIRKDSEDNHQVQIKKVERNKEKSFFNYLWLCVLQGLKQTVL